MGGDDQIDCKWKLKSWHFLLSKWNMNNLKITKNNVNIYKILLTRNVCKQIKTKTLIYFIYISYFQQEHILKVWNLKTRPYNYYVKKCL